MTRIRGKVRFACGVLLLLAALPSFAQITFSDFSDVTSLALNGSAAQATNVGGMKVLRLTPDQPHLSGTAWFMTQQQSVASGFTSVFTFQITHTGTQADGLSFIIQNSTGTGFGTSARGGSGGAIGYGAPDAGDNGVAIPDSLAVEFDTFQNSWDPDSNHIAIQSCGLDPNTQDHNAICPDHAPANLGIASGLSINLADGNVHTAVIDYDPGTLRVFLDDFGTPLIVASVDLSTLLSLNNGNAWVGFGGATGALRENNDIQTWTFTPATTTTTITQMLTPTIQTDTNYVFGSYNHKVSYSGANSGDSLTVTAIPIDQQTFHDTRLIGTPFSNSQCVIYDGTGGLCVEFEVTCSQTGGSDCTGLDYDLFNNFNTSQTIVGAGVLKAQIGTNNWTNIIESFTQTRNDPGSRSGSKGFSDFILVQGATALPTVTITSPANGSTVLVGQSVPITFACAPDANAPLVTLTGCTGLLNGMPVMSGTTMVFNAVGTGTLAVTGTDSVLDTFTATSNFTIGQSPAFTSGNAATFQVGNVGTFTVMTTGFPPAVITESGALPMGVTLLSNGDGTATLMGNPAAGTGGVYNITLTATNSAGSMMQGFTLTVNQAPAITSANNATFQQGVASSFTVTTTGFPAASIAESGTLPGGVTFTDNHNGTGTLGGTPTVSGTFPISFTATNTAGTASQSFTLTVSAPQLTVTPTSINFGTAKLFSLLFKNVTLKNNGSSTVAISKVAVTPGAGADSDDYTPINFCGSTLKAGKSCIITVVFFADDLGTPTATLYITDNAVGSPQAVSLTGTVTKTGH